MKRTSLGFAALIALSAVPALSFADDPASPLAFNIGVVNDYRFRGISQTRGDPAIQGGIDYALPAGFYIGAWASNIKWIKDNGVDGDVELDLYGGYKGEIQKDLTFDVGVLQYAYVGNHLSDTGGGGVYKNANTTELYGALTYSVFTAKVSYALTNLFGNYNFNSDNGTEGSAYFDLSANFDLGNGFSLVPHVGHQEVRHLSVATYNDYSLTLGKDLGKGFSVSVAVIGTDADKNFYVPGAAANSTKFLGKTTGVVGLKYTF